MPGLDASEPMAGAALPAPEEDYYAAVERHFVSLRGSPLFITPKEWHLIHRWRERQIPLRVVRQGLDRAFEKRKQTRTVRSLSYCRQTVEAAYRRFREALAGAREKETPDEEAGRLQDYLWKLHRAVLESLGKVAVSEPELAGALSRCANELALLAAGPVDPDRLAELESRLGELEAILLEAAEASLGDAGRKQCLEQAEQSLAGYRSRMPPEVFRSALQSAYRKRVRARFGLPPLSLFYL